ncbi:DUF3168 domain-containing protein [Paenarthrobacter ilicis]|uniref:DUF3168 domain-containing protein n=1 Tax=Paenarthrobacter ilicis TaxID=43665 RepID=UPI0028D49739|nr:DUF3168 domain-containing protein [Paenarthrobacter ilicis]
MSKAHYDALEVLLPDGFRKFRGVAENDLTEDNPDGSLSADDYPYIVLGGNLGTDSTEAMNGDDDTREVRFRITYAGLTFDAVLIVMEAVRNALRGKRLIVEGWSTGTLRHEQLLDIRADRDFTVPGIGLHPQFAVDEFTVVSAR